MNLTHPEDLKARLLDAWRKGKYFAVVRNGACDSSAMRYPLKAPSAAESLKEFSAVRRWTDEWAQCAEKENLGGLSLEWKEWDHRQLGKNRIPIAVVFPSVEALARYLGKRKELDSWREVLCLTLDRFPALEPWVAKHPLALLENASSLGHLLDLTDWYLAHKNSSLYLRQVSVPGVDTKFIERNRAVLRQWWSLLDSGPAHPDVASIFPGLTISETDRSDFPEESGTSRPQSLSFEERFGFRSKPEILRFRVLERESPFSPYTDISVPSEEFARAPLPFSRILIIENDITALSLPALSDTAVIFGRGFGFTGLAKSGWLGAKDLWYWGDLDTNGFAILDQLRAAFPSARSFLMDRETLMSNRAKWVREPKPANCRLTRLTEAESALYRDLREGALDPDFDGTPRLEQELIPWETVLAALEKIVSGGSF